MTLRIETVDKWFPGRRKGAPQHVLRGVDLEVPSGQFVSLIGHSGCGKSTLLNVVAGLEPPTSGAVTLDGTPVTGPGPDRAIVFQNYSLLPRLSLFDNVRVAVREARGERGTAADALAETYLTRVGLWEHRAKRPHEVSGGMQQRTAVARAFAVEPRLLLLDEPFGALDAQTKLQMQEWLMQLWSDFKKTVVFVTHDVEEAIYLSDEIHVMGTRPGRVLESIPITLPRPRARTTALTPDFIAIKERCMKLLAAHVPALEAA
jgi:ABC-type nitrate/sulfonate/bicarbonate transport system ATPase subunit